MKKGHTAKFHRHRLTKKHLHWTISRKKDRVTHSETGVDVVPLISAISFWRQEHDKFSIEVICK